MLNKYSFILVYHTFNELKANIFNGYNFNFYMYIFHNNPINLNHHMYISSIENNLYMAFLNVIYCEYEETLSLICFGSLLSVHKAFFITNSLKTFVNSSAKNGIVLAYLDNTSLCRQGQAVKVLSISDWQHLWLLRCEFGILVFNPIQWVNASLIIFKTIQHVEI